MTTNDPVCGMAVTDDSPHVLMHEGARVFFCSANCKKKFANDPAKYSAGAIPATMAPAAGAAAEVAVIYTCPMHPEIRRDRPGACP